MTLWHETSAMSIRAQHYRWELPNKVNHQAWHENEVEPKLLNGTYKLPAGSYTIFLGHPRKAVMRQDLHRCVQRVLLPYVSPFQTCMGPHVELLVWSLERRGAGEQVWQVSQEYKTSMCSVTENSRQNSQRVPVEAYPDHKGVKPGR
jgi:hypothetical protein